MFGPSPESSGEPVTLQTEGDEGERASIIPADELTGLPVVQLSDDKIAELVIARLTRWYASGRAIRRPTTSAFALARDMPTDVYAEAHGSGAA